MLGHGGNSGQPGCSLLAAPCVLELSLLRAWLPEIASCRPCYMGRGGPQRVGYARTELKNTQPGVGGLAPILVLPLPCCRTGLVELFPVNGQIANILGLTDLMVSCNHSALPLSQESSHRQYVNEWAWLCSKKTLFTKAGGGPIQLTDSSLLSLL